MVTLALAGDTMLGRLVAGRLIGVPAGASETDTLFAPAVRELTAGADACVVNLECCVSDRGQRWPAPGKPFFFRAPPRAVSALRGLGVDCVTLANNHALDFGVEALLDTRTHLTDAGIGVVGAGADLAEARAWRVVEAAGVRVGVLGVTDHPPDFAATPERPGVAFADLRHGVPDWLLETVSAMAGRVDVALVSPHWGPNMTTDPIPEVQTAAGALIEAGATLVAGHSAHLFHGVSGRVLFDLGDLIDDYAVDEVLRNDLGLLFLVTIDERGPLRLEAVPLALDFCHTRLADAGEAEWIGARFTEACARWGTPVTVTGQGRLEVPLR